jgi:SAM-dependent methyltransferase
VEGRVSAPAQAVRAFFDGRVAEWDRDRYTDPTYVGRGTVALKWLREMGGGKRVLDVGCGAGHQALGAVRAGDRVVAMDFSYPMARATRDRLRAEAPAAPAAVIVADAQHLPFRAGTFDAAMALGVVGFVPDRAAMMAESRRVLRPWGQLVCDVGMPERRVLLQAVSRGIEAPFRAAARLARRLSGRAPGPQEERGWYSRNFVKHAPHEIDALLAGAGFHPVARGGAGFGELRVMGRALLPWRVEAAISRALCRLSTTPLGGPVARHALTHLVRSISVPRPADLLPIPPQATAAERIDSADAHLPIASADETTSSDSADVHHRATSVDAPSPHASTDSTASPDSNASTDAATADAAGVTIDTVGLQSAGIPSPKGGNAPALRR